MCKCRFARPIRHEHVVVAHCAPATEALGANCLKGQPPSTSLAVIDSGKYGTTQTCRGEVTPNGEVNAIHSNFLDRLDVRFDHAIGRTEERMELIIRIGGGTQ